MKESSYLKGSDHYLELMRKLSAFRSFDDDQLKQILSLSKIRVYAKGESVIEEGEYGTWLFCIISGRVRVAKDGKKISTGHSGDVFGEMGLIDGASRSATVTAACDDVMCLAVDASFLDRMDDNERNGCYLILYRLFAKILADRLRAANEELAAAKDKMAVMRRKIIDAD